MAFFKKFCSAVIGLCLVACCHAQTLVLLHSFSGTDGSGPAATLVFGPGGNLYGTTTAGGAAGDGTIFSITRGGAFTLLHSFQGTDGANPFGALLYASDGNLYGMTNTGGSANQGVIYRISSTGEFAVIHSFQGFDGANPYGALVEGTDFAGYGLTAGGGQYGYGTLFRIDAYGNYSVLHSFDETDGSYPYGSLLGLGGGLFGGNTRDGGANSHGVAFVTDEDGNLSPTLSYAGAYYQPYGAFVAGSNGLYYTTSFGGGYGYGLIYSIDDQMNLNAIYAFDPSVGGNPFNGVTIATDGTFVGTDIGGGLYPTIPDGAIFQVSATGAQEYNLHVFQGADGSFPIGGVVQGPNSGSNEVFFGTTYTGGANNLGEVYSVTVPPNL